jgi:hypothetical protein
VWQLARCVVQGLHDVCQHCKLSRILLPTASFSKLAWASCSFLAAWVCCGPRKSAPPLTACLPLVRFDGEWGCFESLGAVGCPQTDQPSVWQKLERELPRMRELHHISQTCESAQDDSDNTHAEDYQDYTRDDYTDDD